MFDFLYDITIQEDKKTRRIIPSLLVIGIAIVLNVAFIAIFVKVLFF